MIQRLWVVVLVVVVSPRWVRMLILTSIPTQTKVVIDQTIREKLGLITSSIPSGSELIFGSNSQSILY